MSKVSLRVYNHEIESMIEAGRLDEAVAHCQHILKTFSMHVETYRLLGKCFLEARRYADAADIFQRTLMAVPDDFVAQVGMSIIRDDEGRLDDAIWHMERAFEVQPSNTAIQSELRRLYGRRDGVEPSRIRLSRDALANMYSQGELYNQAIAEIRAVLAEDNNRPDLHVMLARAYYRSGQKVEAAEVAATLLKKYSFCLDALRVLVDVLPEESQTENTQVYRQRLHLLDPYSSFVSGSVFGAEQVPDGSVNLNRLEYDAASAVGPLQPNWASTLGIKLVDEKPNLGAIWAKPSDSSKSSPLPSPDVSVSASKPQEEDKSVPEWLRNVTSQGSSAPSPVGSANSAQPQKAEPLGKADLPDWLKSLTPKEIKEPVPGPQAVPTPASPAGSGDLPEWLKGLGTVKPADMTPVSSQGENKPVESSTFPDWLKEMSTNVPSVKAAPLPVEKEEPPSPEVTETSPQVAPVPLDEPSSPLPKPPAPAWGEDTPFSPTGEAKPLNIEDDALAWLESLAARQGAKEEELLIKPENRTDDMPEWLHASPEQPSGTTLQPPEPGQSEAGTTEIDLPPVSDLATVPPAPADEISTTEPGVTPPVIPATEETPDDWLKALAKEQTSFSEEFTPQQTIPSVENPSIEPVPSQPVNPEEKDILSQAESMPVETEPTPLENIPATIPLVEEGMPHIDPSSLPAKPPALEEGIPDWLEGLASSEEKIPGVEYPQETGTQSAEMNPIEPGEALAGIQSSQADASLPGEGIAAPLEIQPFTPVPGEEKPAEDNSLPSAQPLEAEAASGDLLENLQPSDSMGIPDEIIPEPTRSEEEFSTVEQPSIPAEPQKVEEDSDAWLRNLVSPPAIKSDEPEMQTPSVPSDIPGSPNDGEKSPPFIFDEEKEYQEEVALASEGSEHGEDFSLEPTDQVVPPPEGIQEKTRQPFVEDTGSDVETPKVTPELAISELESTENIPQITIEPVVPEYDLVVDTPQVPPEPVVEKQESIVEIPQATPEPAISELESELDTPRINPEPVVETQELEVEAPPIIPEPVGEKRNHGFQPLRRLQYQ